MTLDDTEGEGGGTRGGEGVGKGTGESCVTSLSDHAINPRLRLYGRCDVANLCNELITDATVSATCLWAGGHCAAL